ncbi:hypothetical protein DY000_02022934 [Brassica cretica]|uniref:SWIM-type domain-containing protein n=1 Tax=Brassica cretica TaxID=69181 RepID=A0ABQ7EMA2_BRACR|nr:hypothetical protein DY000_02022934 [Brassica cretica]
MDCVVDLKHGKCDCGVYAVEKIPCSHAIAAGTSAGLHISTLVCPVYSKDFLFAGYSENIYPCVGQQVEERTCFPPEVKRVEKIPCSHAIAAGTSAGLDISTLERTCFPPDVKRGPGRQKKSRWQSWFELSRMRGRKPRKQHMVYRCSKCKETGHTKPQFVQCLPEDLQVSRLEDFKVSRPGLFLLEDLQVSRPGFFLPEDLQVSRPVFSLPEDLQNVLGIFNSRYSLGIFRGNSEKILLSDEKFPTTILVDSTQIVFSTGKHQISLLRKHICQKLQVCGTLSRRIYNGERCHRIYYDGERQHVMMIQSDIASIGGTGSTVFVYGGGGENLASRTRRKWNRNE